MRLILRKEPQMKTVSLGLMAFTAFTAFTQAQAAVITGGHYDAPTDSAVLSVSYSGGCEEHKFSLEFGECAESYPSQARAKLIHDTKDTCKADISEVVLISLKEFDC